MKVIVIEDDIVLCDAYRYYFESYTDYFLVGVYQYVEDALEHYETTLPDIIITDISVAGMNGIDGISLFKAKDPNVKVLVISVHDGLNWIKGAFENMTDGYLSKPINKQSLYEALNSIKYEGAVMSNNIVKKVMASFQKKSLNIFSEREKQIVNLLREGATYKGIAKTLYVSASTVSFHIQNIYQKLNVNSKSEALERIRELE